MKTKHLNFKKTIYLLSFLPLYFYGQKQSQQFSERYDVNADVLVEVNTTYANIQFETWNKNSVEVVAEISAEDMPDKEFKKIMENLPLEILGSRQKVVVNTKGNRNAFFHFSNIGPQEYTFDVMPFVVPMPEIETFQFSFADSLNFDYEKYQKEGEKYMKEWSQKWEKNTLPQMKIEMDEWRKNWEKQRAEMQANREKMKEEREKMREKIQEEREKQREELKRIRSEVIFIRDSLRATAPGNSSYSYVFSDSGKHQKVKISIVIKVPKGAKLQLNVRFGEIKLAENLKDVKAKLSYSTLWANRVDGQNTLIESAYAPLNITRWNEGSLHLKYVTDALIKSVNNIRLHADNSVLSIDDFTGTGSLESRFGKVIITNHSPFEHLNIFADNSEVTLKLAQQPYQVQIESQNGEISYPKEWKLTDEKNTPFFRLISGYTGKKTETNRLEIRNTFGRVRIQ